MDTEFLRGNPGTGEKTTEASLTPKFTLPVSTLARATNLYNLLYQPTAERRTKTLFYTITSWHQPEGAPTPTCLLCRP